MFFDGDTRENAEFKWPQKIKVKEIFSPFFFSMKEWIFCNTML